jgi:phosphatidylglycerol:prolipoprotein diacylglycerol transferase
MILLGVLLGSLLVIKESKKFNISKNKITDMLFYTMIFGIIGARLYYVIFNLDYYSIHQAEIFEIWNGGLAIHGGILAGFITILLYSRKYKISTLKILDICALGLIVAQAIGRWGNFFNSEAYGGITTFEHLKSLQIPEFIINGMYINGEYRVPTFLYESIWCLTGFIALLMIRKYKYIKSGVISGIYLIWYSLGRLIIEGMRTDSLMLGSIKVAQLVSVLLIVIGVIMVIICRKQGTQFDNLYKEKAKEINF